MVWQSFLRYLTQSSLNDQCGRLNSTWTVVILVLFALVTFFIQVSSDNTVTCWTPPQFTYSMVAYTNQVCSHPDSHFHSAGPLIEEVQNDNMKLSLRGMEPFKLKWRWLPLILIVQALLFKLPELVLSAGQGLVGFKFTKISGLTDGYETLNMADRAQMGRQVGRYLKSWIASTVMKGCPWGWLTLLFLFTKLLYVINVIIQLAVMDSILTSENQSSFGKLMFENIIGNNAKGSNQMDKSFSRIVVCDFQVRHLQNLSRWTLQCTVNNMADYEILLCFIWMWLVVVAVITTISGFVQLLTVLLPAYRKGYIKTYLYMSNEVFPSPSDNDISRFAGSEITEDGVFILKAIGEASSEHLVRDAVIYLWHFTHGQQDPVPQGPPQHGGPPPYLSQGGSAQTYGPGGTVISPPPTAPPQQVRYRPQTGPEADPLMTNQPM